MKNIVLLSFLISPISLLAVANSDDCWDGSEYKKGNWVQAQATQKFLQDAGADFLVNKVVCDAGCGTGEIAISMAKHARSVLGFDASESMITKANEINNVTNVEFKVLSAESFDVLHCYDSLTCFFCLHWIEDKQTVFTNFYKALKPGGKLLCTVATTEERTVVRGVIAELFPQLQGTYPILQDKTMQELTGRFNVATRDVDTMLVQCGFQSVMIEQKVIDVLFESREKFADWQRPIFMSRPVVKLIPAADVERCYGMFVDAVWAKLNHNADGAALYPFTVTLVSAQKPS